MTVAVIVPPGGQFAYPSLAPASLKGYLQQAGIETDLFDFNIVGFDHITSSEGVEDLFERLERRAGEFRRTHAGDAEHLHQIDWLLSLPPQQRQEFCGLRSRLQDTGLFCHETAYEEVLHRLAQLVGLAELAYDPLYFLPGSLVGGMFARVRTFPELLGLPSPYDQAVGQQLGETSWDRYEVIGLSAFSFDQVVWSLRLAPQLRTRSDALLVLGGNCLSQSELPQGLRRILAETFDVVVVGDGELPLVRIVEVRRGLRELPEVPNAFYLDRDRLHHTSAVYRYRFESGTAPDFSGLPMDLYPMPEPVLPFRLSNGCEYGRCTFCSESIDKGEASSRAAYVEPEADQVVRHLADLQGRWNASVFVNCSSLVTAAGCAEMGRAVERAGLDIQWFAMVRAEHAFTEERVEATANGGAGALNFGIESFNPRVNRLMRKGIDVRRAPALLGSFRGRGVAVTCYTMANFPGETIDEFDQHLDVLEREIDNYDIFFKSNFMLVAGTPVFEQADRYGIELDQGQLVALRKQNFPIYLLPDDRSGGTAYRWPGDCLEEKLDHYHRMLLRLALRRPLWFARDLEVVSQAFFWEPEYLMIARRLGQVQRLPGMSLGDLRKSRLRLADGARLTRLTEDRWVLTLPDRGIALYYGHVTGTLLSSLSEGRSFADAFDDIVSRHPTARDLVELYEHVHRELRDLGAVEIAPLHTPAASSAPMP